MKLDKLLFTIALACGAQMLSAAPHIGCLYPSSVRRGDTVTLQINGQGLNNIKGALFDRPDGLEIVSIEPVRPFPNPTWRQKVFLLEYLKIIEGANGNIPYIPDDYEDWRHHPWWMEPLQLNALQRSIVALDLCTRRDPLQSSPSISQLALVTLKVSPEAAVGRREIRLFDNGGVSLPLPFFIDAARNVSEELFMPPGAPAVPPKIYDEMPLTLNGRVMPREQDVFLLRLKKGQNYVFRAKARSLHPFIGDAVPGHFQMVMALETSSGEEAAFADDYCNHPDPVLQFTPPADGVYRLVLRDNLYRGRADFVYVVNITTGQIAAPEGQSSPPSTITAIPARIKGILSAPGARHDFFFTARAGEELVATVDAHRSGSPLDGKLELFAPDGKLLAANDDAPEKPFVGEYNRQLDPALSFQTPMDGKYRLTVSETTNKGGANYFYTLSLRPRRPDFSVYTTRSNCGGGKRPYAKINVEIMRRDGYSGAIKLRPENPEITISNQGIVPPGKDKAAFTLNWKKVPRNKPQRIVIFADGESSGTKLTHQVQPCDSYNQAFAYDHLVPAADLYW